MYYSSSAEEKERLLQLYKLEILDTPAEQDFDNIVKLASQICNVPFSYISMIDADRQWFKSTYQLQMTGDLDRSTSICSFTIEQNDILEVPDCEKDQRFCNFPYITGDPNIRYYAGIPLISNGCKVGTLCVCDIVPRMLTEEQMLAIKVLSHHTMNLMELRIRNKQLTLMSEAQNKIISIIGHDVKNPLSSFRMLFNMQKDASTAFNLEELAEVNELLGKQLDSTIGLLDNLVQWGKLQLENKDYKAQPVNIEAVVMRTLRELEVAASLKGNMLNKQIPQEVYIDGDDAVVEFILRNLLTNANKFTENGEITIQCNKEDDNHYISVTDTGIGMSEDAIEKVLNNTGAFISLGTRDERGSGLGLSLIREFLAKNNQKLSIKSAVGKGTTVSFQV